MQLLKKKDVDMLHGPIMKGLFAIALPLMIMNVLQSLFNIIDMTVLKSFGPADGCGVLYKCHLTLDWVGDNFVHQAGPFLMGMASSKTRERDLRVASPLWHRFEYFWRENGKAAHSLTRRICEVSEGRAGVGLAAQLSGGIFYSAALAAEMIWDPDACYADITERLSARRYITKT